jgi:hypothetical protein
MSRSACPTAFPLSETRIFAFPPSLNLDLNTGRSRIYGVFISSFTADAGRSITSPAAIFIDDFVG